MPAALKIVSGGQTGVDRAALDAALAVGSPCGGWCPLGRRAEDGEIDARYPLCETPTSDYAQRTRLNVRDSDGTLILYRRQLRGGTKLTHRNALDRRKPHFLVDLTGDTGVAPILEWIQAQNIRILNIAGPRESQQPGIYDQAFKLIEELLSTVE